MQQIADWLQKLSLSQYAERFSEHGIDGSVLRYLTDQDLEKIGVLLGHRRKMLAAMAELGSAAALIEPKPQDTADRQQAPIRTPAAAAPSTSAAAEVGGERRHVTVMFCDLVDSTRISARLDAEEWRDLVGAYLDAPSKAVVEMGGKVAKKLGDGLMLRRHTN